MRPDLLQRTPAGLYCPQGDFYIDPKRVVPRAIVTHAHSDHARPGCGRYLTAPDGKGVLHARIGAKAEVLVLPYGRTLNLNGVAVSLHPAGHILGSVQVKVEHAGETWVVTGDYKTEPDPTCAPFELVRCHTLITETTFGLPIYRWPPQVEVFAKINAWWQGNRLDGRTSVLFGYSLGKAQRLLAGLDPSIGPIFVHDSVDEMNVPYREAGIDLPPTRRLDALADRETLAGAIVVSPPSAGRSAWRERFSDPSPAFASGWMQTRARRRPSRSQERGFILSDHVDWPSLFHVIRESGAQRVFCTHGYNDVVVEHLQSLGLQAEALE